MSRWTIVAALCAIFWAGCAGPGSNPILDDWETPYEVPPFEAVRTEHFKPALEEAIARHDAEIAAIVANPAAPDFENTVAALDASGTLYRRVAYLFGTLNSVDATEEMQATAKALAPLRTQHNDDVLLDEKLFARIEAVYRQRTELGLDAEQERLLGELYREFVRGGAGLDAEKKAALRAVNEELALASVQFGENLLKETRRYEMVVEREADLAGLAPGVVQAAAETAAKRGHAGKWVFTTDKPSMIPFLQQSERRALREELFKAYITRGDHGDELDNKTLLARMASLRVKRAELLGFETHADYVLATNMAQTPERVYALLEQLWRPAMAAARKEVEAMQALIHADGETFDLQPWDWWFYSERIKKAEYDLDDAELRPYFELERVRDGAFMVAEKLWGLSFHERLDLPRYHEEVKVFEVRDRDGNHVGILYTDYFPRPTKRGGAWMNAIRKQYRSGGVAVTPVVTNNGNFTRPVGDEPSLLSFEEVQTLFHEFGHALHGLLSSCTYQTLSGTSVPRDFVELPSQIMENWAAHPEVLKLYARHYENGRPIPDALAAKIAKAGKFNQGFITGEYLAAAFLDMDWHTLSEATERDATDFENAAMERIGLVPQIVPRYRSTYFAHIFSGGYSSGYYSYTWAAVLDADAFGAFEEHGIFDQATAESFRRNILERGNTADPMELYTAFRGREPKVDALLKRKGFN